MNVIEPFDENETPAASRSPKPTEEARQDGKAEIQFLSEDQNSSDLRFANPLIQEIMETWRSRQDMVRAESKITLQIKSICRRFTAGDKKEADALYKSMQNGREHPLADVCHMACIGLLLARAPLQEQRTSYEKTLTKLGAKLPIAHIADTIKGVNHLTLAKIVAECGDLTTYEKGIAGVWKRAGLAVIDGGRQRRVSGDAALLHGYSPERRAVFWNIADSLFKAQGKEETAGPYRQFYDKEKERIRPLVESDGHAHNRALRHMTKQLLADIREEWLCINAAQ